MKIKKDILIICSSLNYPGGIERSIVNIANLMDENEHSVTILILDNKQKSYYTLNENINLYNKDFNFGITNQGNILSRKFSFIRNIYHLRKFIININPDIVLSTEYHLSIVSWIATYQLKVKVISREAHQYYWIKKNKFWTLLYNYVYPKLAYVVCLNEYEEKFYKKMGCRTKVIFNFLNKKLSNIKKTDKKKVILTVGWLIKRKGVDLIPEIASLVFSESSNWHWKIIGKGPEYNDINRSLEAKNINKYVSIIPPVSEDSIYKYYSEASVYVLTSRSEGFPNVLMEAMAFSTPCISFNCPSGPSDILSNGIDGILVESENIIQISNAIISLIKNDNLRIQMGEKAYLNIQRFSNNKAYQLWEQIFNS